MRRSLVALSTCLLFCAASPVRAQNPTPYWDFEVGSWIGSGFRSPSGGFSHCAIMGNYRSGISMAIAMDADYDIQLAVGNPDWRLELDEVYEVGLQVDGRGLGRFTAIPANRSVLFIEVGPRPDVLDRLRRGYLLEIVAAHETFGFALTDTFEALGKLKQCVDSARMWTERRSNPFGEGSTGTDPDPNATRATEAEFRDTVAGVLEASGLPAVRFVDPMGTEHAGAALAWRASGLEGALFYLETDAAGAEAFTRELIGEIAKQCGGTFGSQTRDLGRIGDTALSQFSLACESPSATEFVAASVMASETGTLIFVHFAQGDGLRLRDLNEQLGRVLTVIAGQ